eukprot:5028350-Pyramimonas_sp.AAC.1
MAARAGARQNTHEQASRYEKAAGRFGGIRFIFVSNLQVSGGGFHGNASLADDGKRLREISKYTVVGGAGTLRWRMAGSALRLEESRDG